LQPDTKSSGAVRVNPQLADQMVDQAFLLCTRSVSWKYS